MLQVENVDLAYGAANALRGVSLDRATGEITCILGRNGVGKTSLLRAIVGRHPVRSRAHHVGRHRHHLAAALRTLPPRHRLRAAGARDLSAADRSRESRDRLCAAAARAAHHIRKRSIKLFPVLKTMLHRRGGDLSGGQQQQLSIARALVTQPRLLVLDEPTEGIQPSVIKDIGRAISYLRSKGEMAIVLVEQYFDFARELADRFAVMERGAIVMTGGQEELQSPDVRKLVSV